MSLLPQKHKGDLEVGHYTTIARNVGGDKWHLYDDDLIEPIGMWSFLATSTAAADERFMCLADRTALEQKHTQREAYLLFYSKR